jgi:hypothetical protein
VERSATAAGEYLYNLANIMNPFGDLSDQNGDQVKKYLKFFRQKREGIVRAISNEINECKADRVTEDMYSKEDVDDIIDFLNSTVRVWILLKAMLLLWKFLLIWLWRGAQGHITHDMSTLINMGALTVSQLLVDAQDKGVDLNLETASLENQVDNVTVC